MGPVEDRWLRLVATTMAALSLALLASSLVVLLVAGSSVAHLTGDVSFDSVAVISYLPHVAAGLYLTLRLPRHPIGWLLLVAALATSLQSLAGRAILYTHVVLDDPIDLTEILAVVGDAFWVPGLAIGLVGLLILYPNGRPATRWSKWVLWAMAVTASLYLVVTLFARAPLYFLESVPNPLGVFGDETIFEAGQAAAFIGMFLVGLPAGIAALIVRWRRATSTQRQQLKWLLWAAVIQVIAVVASIVGSEIIEGPVQGGWTGALTDVAAMALPAAIVVAITRHGLYEIDRLISRTVSYALVAGVLGVVFLGVVTASTALFPTDDPLVVAVATLTVAALFNPLRKRVQLLVDRRFNRARYDSQRVIDDFAETLRDETDPDEVVDGWVGVVEETMQPAAVGVWLR